MILISATINRIAPARPSAVPICAPHTGTTLFTTAPRASGSNCARRTCRATATACTNPWVPNTQLPTTTHNSTAGTARMATATCSVGAKPASPPDPSARRKASGAPGAITTRTTPTCSGRGRPNAKVVPKPIAGTMTSTLMRPRINRDGDRKCWMDTIGVMVVPMAAITENTVVNDRTLTSHSGMISIKGSTNRAQYAAAPPPCRSVGASSFPKTSIRPAITPVHPV